MKYVLDANIFIESKNRYYGIDFCPAFWDWLVEKNKSEIIFSIDRIKDELHKGNDELKDWSTNHSDLFLPVGTDISASLTIVSKWVTTQGFTDFAISDFFNSADYFLIAFALTHTYTVVTHELPSDSKKKIKIPTVCKGLGIPFINTFSLLRNEKALFVLGKEFIEN